MHRRRPLRRNLTNTVDRSRDLGGDGCHGVSVSAEVGRLEDGGGEGGGGPDAVEGHAEGVHAVRPDVARLLPRTQRRVPELWVLPPPVSVCQGCLPRRTFPRRLLLRRRQPLNRRDVALERAQIAQNCLHHSYRTRLRLLGIGKRRREERGGNGAGEDEGHEAAGLRSLFAAVRGEALAPRNLHRSRGIPPKRHRAWRKPHQRTVARRVVVPLLGVGDVRILLKLAH
mmetsp:Transcript_46846/g.93935  ORF Transcript_46846/g.93935 Transcript_46846/m.93935 type:complete len:227 (+) Transcript_46846:259-939(+)